MADIADNHDRTIGTAMPNLIANVHVTALPLRPPHRADRWQPRTRVRGRTVEADPGPPSETDPLLVSLQAMPVGDPARAGARDKAIEWYLPMAGYLAQRFRNHGEPLDDVTQAAVVGLIKAIDRYDAGRGIPFVGYAFPTVLGEIKRHFRDTAWDIRVPRRIQELYRELATVTEELTHELRCSPTTELVAQRLGVSEREVGVARLAAHSYRLLSLDQPRSDGDGDRDGDGQLTDLIGVPDPALAAVENRMVLRYRLARLSERDRRIITMRFDAELTQSQIAAQLGLSQMHISRLLSRSLSQLRQMA